MSRKKRYLTKGVPQLILLSGDKGEPCFFVDKDYEFFLQILHDAINEFNCDIHAYILMPNHVHLLATAHSPSAVPNMMQTISSRYIVYFNKTYGLTDNIWQSGYKSSPLESESYLLKSMIYIEQNPLRASLVDRLSDYRWSSYHHNVLLQSDGLLRPHALYMQLSDYQEERVLSYKKQLDVMMDSNTLGVLSNTIEQQGVLGSREFEERITDTSPLYRDTDECTDCVMYY